MRPIDASAQTMRITINPEILNPQAKPATPATQPRKTLRFARDTANSSTSSQFNELFQSMYDAAILCDLEGRIVDVNIRALEFFGYDKPDFCRLNIRDVVSGLDDNLIVTIRANLKVDRFTLIEAYCARADGTFFPGEIAANQLHLAQNGLLCFFLRDITVRKQHEDEIKEKTQQLQEYATKMESLAEERAKQLVHADRLVRLGVMSAGIAHEVNNPTLFISSNVDMAAKFWPEIEAVLSRVVEADLERQNKQMFILDEFPKVLNGMRMGVERIQHIVKGLKLFAYQGDVVKEPFEANVCVTQALDMFRNALKKFVVVNLLLEEQLPKILGDNRQIVQVLVNLFSNAADAMDYLGKGDITIHTRLDGARVRIEVEDTGPGIPPDKLNSIWEPFFTTKPIGKGTGLGLSISQSIIKAHNGTITAENKPEGGARFILEFPAYYPPQSTPTAD